MKNAVIFLYHLVLINDVCFFYFLTQGAIEYRLHDCFLENQRYLSVP